MSNKRVEFWRDPAMETLIEDIIEIFTKIEGVNLVRLSGLTIRARKVSGKSDIPPQAIDNIIRKLYKNNIINILHITKCPHCGEISYVVKTDDPFNTKPKLCDTCSTLFALLDGTTLEKL